MRNVLTPFVATVIGAAVFFCSVDASAQAPGQAAAKPAATSTYKEQKVDGGQSVIFNDDSLLTGDGAPLIAATGHPGRAFRANLIRPRTQFLSELLKTVETL